MTPRWPRPARIAGPGAVLVLALAFAPAPARADVALAEPGECAHAAPGASLVRPVIYGTGGPVAGDPALLLGLAAVGAPPEGPLLPTPGADGFPGTGPCDTPGSGCMGPVAPGPSRPGPVTGASGRAGGRIRESPGRPAPPPGLP